MQVVFWEQADITLQFKTKTRNPENPWKSYVKKKIDLDLRCHLELQGSDPTAVNHLLCSEMTQSNSLEKALKPTNDIVWHS